MPAGSNGRCDTSGETEESVSAWTPDTLHSLMLRLFDEADRRYNDRFVAQEAALAVRAVRVAEEFSALTIHVDQILNERDVRYGERFEASQVAINAAVAEREKAVQAAFIAQEKAVAAALASADRAVAKAEVASEKRFESVNEFRQTLTDQAANFISRTEVDTKITAVSEKLSDGAIGVSKEISNLVSRLDRIEATRIGGQERRVEARAGMTTAMGVATIVVTLILAALAVITFIAARTP